jgi:ATP-binding cassette subfamily C protein CydC
MITFWRLLGLMRPNVSWMALAVLVSAVATAAHVALMATSGWFITSMALAGMAGVSMNYFTPAAMIRGFSILRTAGRYAERLIGHEATLRFVANLRIWLFGRIERAAPSSLGAMSAGDLLTRLRVDIDRLELAFLRIIAPILAGLLVILPVLTLLVISLPPVAVLLALLLACAGVGVPVLLLALHRRVASTAVEATADLNAALVGMIDGQAELAIYDPEGLHRKSLIGHSDRLLVAEDQLALGQALGNAAIPLFAHLGVVILLAIGIPAVRAGGLPAADLPMLMLLSVALFDAVSGWPLAVQTVPVVLASAKRVFGIADREPAVPEPLQTELVSAPLTLHFSNVCFRHPGAASEGLRDLDLVLKSTKRIAILGASGSGKSTLAALAMRFLATQRGAILLNGHDYRQLSGDHLRQHIALLAQNDHIFSGTIRDNLLFADPAASQPALEQACRTAQILSLIESLPEGFDTWVGAHGRALSGGEARRLLLARTLLRRPEILILDEPTEGLDAGTEHAVMAAILADHPEASLLLLTHRLVGLAGMDEIYRLELGQLVAIPKHSLAIPEGRKHSRTE